MAKIDKKQLIKLIENLVDKLVENKVEKLVEKRIQKLLPMLIEHEVNRLIRESNSNNNTVHEENSDVAGSYKESLNEGRNEKVKNKNDLREHFKSLIGADVHSDSDDNKTLSYTSENVNSGINNTAMNEPVTTPDGKRVDMNNPNVQKVANIMNQDFSGALEKMKKNSGNNLKNMG